MNDFDLTNYKLTKSDGVYTFKNLNTTIGFVRFNKEAEVEYIFVNPIFRKKGVAKKITESSKKRDWKTINFSKTNKSFRVKTARVIR